MHDQLKGLAEMTEATLHHDERLRIPSGVLQFEDLSERARTEGFQRLLLRTDARHVTLLDAIARVLHRRRGSSVLLTGQQGVGKTAAIWDVARRAAAGSHSFLQAKRFLAIDCRKARFGDGKELLAVLI